MFACSVPPNVHIYNFYTADCPNNMQCKGSSVVRSIEWFENDMGLVTAAKDGSCSFYDLLYVKENAGQRNIEKDFNQKNVTFQGVCLIPNTPYECLAVGNDNKVWMSQQKNHVTVKQNLS